MPQPKADDKRVNAPTLTDEDFDLGDFLDEDDLVDGKEKTLEDKPVEEGELIKTKKELDDAKKLADVLAAQNNRLLEAIQSKPVQKSAAVELPKQPDNFDELEAYSDPKSASWKWRVRAEETERKREQAELLAAIGGYIDDKLQAQNQIYEIKRMETELVAQEKIQPDELEDFRRFLTTQKALSMQDLYHVFQKKTGKKKAEDTSVDVNPSMPNSSEFSGPQIRREADELNIDFEKSLLRGVKGVNTLF